MATFTYHARDASGKPEQGEVSAASRIEAARSLRLDGKTVISVAPLRRASGQERVLVREPALPGDAPAPAAAPRAAPRLSKEDVRSFAQQMAVMLETGVSLSDALEACADPRNSPGFARTLDDVIAQVQAGATFSSALARHPRVFSLVVVNMVRASEASGQLAPMLRRIAEFLAYQHMLTRRIKGAVTYPAVMLVLAVGVVAFLMAFVLPRFATIYAGKEKLLPAVTRVMMSISTHLTQWLPYVAGGGALLLVAAALYLSSPSGRGLLDRAKLFVPLFGRLFHKTYLARSLRTFGALLQAGVSMLESVELTRCAVGSAIYARLWAEAAERLQHGRQLSDAVGESPLVPRGIRKMLEAGERGGKLGEVMDRAATHCEEEIAADVKAITGLIEPAIVIFLGIVVGTVVVSMLLPIFTLSKTMRPGGM